MSTLVEWNLERGPAPQSDADAWEIDEADDEWFLAAVAELPKEDDADSD